MSSNSLKLTLKQNCKICNKVVYYKEQILNKVWDNNIENNDYKLVKYNLCNDCLYDYEMYECCYGCKKYNGKGDLCIYCRRKYNDF